MNSAQICEASMCFMNCALEKKKSKCAERFEEICAIYNYPLELSSKMKKTPAEHDVKFLFGDLHFRLALEKATCAYLAKNEEYAEMLNHDQLWSHYSESASFPSMEEDLISFPPTFRFVKGTSNYDLESSSPAWCDRILWSTNNHVKSVKYSSVESIQHSDHKPIYGIYSIRFTDQQDSANKNESSNSSPGFEQVTAEETKHPVQSPEESECRVTTLESFIDVAGTNGKF